MAAVLLSLLAAFAAALLPPPALAEPLEEREPRQVVTHFFVGGTGKIAGLQTVIGNSQSYTVK